MTKLHAQLALFGAIDEVVHRTNNLEIVAAVEDLLPGLTAAGNRGWFGELKQFLARPELAPADQSNSEPRSAETMFPSVDAALAELTAEETQPSSATGSAAEPSSATEPPSPLERPEPPAPPEPEPPAPPEPEPPDAAPPEAEAPPPPDSPPADDAEILTPIEVARTLLAATVLSKLRDVMAEKNIPSPPNLDFPADPLTTVLSQRIRGLPTSDEPIPNLDPIPAGADPVPIVRRFLTTSKDLAEFETRVRGLATIGMIDPAVAEVKPLCTGGLRKIDGDYCSVLTTDYTRTDLTVADIKRVIEPHNWPKLCPSFFREINDQAPTYNRGWTRVLEVVSADPTKWELRTALRYWKGETTPGGGFYINYDLDTSRDGDCMMVEVDAGYLMITPVNAADPAAGVRIRTSKQVRIRGMSSTASAVLACFMGWGDISSHMLTDRAKPPFDGAVDFGKVSQDSGVQFGTSKPADDDDMTDAEIETAAARTELPPGWRGAIISGVQQEVNAFLDIAAVGASSLYQKWSDGLTVKDVEELGAQLGNDLTKYAAGLFNVAANATSPPPANGGE